MADSRGTKISILITVDEIDGENVVGNHQTFTQRSTVLAPPTSSLTQLNVIRLLEILTSEVRRRWRTK